MPPIFTEECISCFNCEEICPCDVLRESDEGPRVAYPDECWHCGACMMDCPTNAIRLDLPLWMRPVTKRLKK